MIKLSLNSPQAPAKQTPPAPFSSALAAAVEAAGAQPVQMPVAESAVKKQPKPARPAAPSTGLLSRGVNWLQQKGRSKKRLHMIETVSLGDKRFVALVKVDGREFLLGGAPSSVGMLADLGAHGLGDLLSVAGAMEVSTPEQRAVPQLAEPASPYTQRPPAEAISLPQPTRFEVAPDEAEEEFLSESTFTLPEPIAPFVHAAPAPSERISITVDAAEEESDFLLADDMETMLRSAVAMEPTTQVQELTTSALEAAPELIVEKERVVAAADRPGPIAVVASSQIVEQVAPAASLGLNFTFQMWPAQQPSSAPSQPSTAAPMASSVGPVPVKHKAKTHIDLESCPELLGEPYVLALLDGVTGAAA